MVTSVIRNPGTINDPKRAPTAYRIKAEELLGFLSALLNLGNCEKDKRNEGAMTLSQKIIMQNQEDKRPIGSYMRSRPRS